MEMKLVVLDIDGKIIDREIVNLSEVQKRVKYFIKKYPKLFCIRLRKILV